MEVRRVETANPAPLGLFGFGMTTILLNLHNAGAYELNSMILAMGAFYGGLAQIIAGIQEWSKGNTFAATAFTSYGSFWLTLVGLKLVPKQLGGFETDKTALACYLLIWGLFTLGLFIGTIRLNIALMVVFGSLTLLFFLLAISDGFQLGTTFHNVIGYEGVFCGLSACYTGLAQVLNEIYGRIILPLGVMKRPNQQG